VSSKSGGLQTLTQTDLKISNLMRCSHAAFCLTSISLTSQPPNNMYIMLVYQ